MVPTIARTRGLALLRDTRGALTTEYVVLIGTVALGSAAAFVGLAVALVSDFETIRGLVLYPFP